MWDQGSQPQDQGLQAMGSGSAVFWGIRDLAVPFFWDLNQFCHAFGIKDQKFGTSLWPCIIMPVTATNDSLRYIYITGFGDAGDRSPVWENVSSIGRRSKQVFDYFLDNYAVKTLTNFPLKSNEIPLQRHRELARTGLSKSFSCHDHMCCKLL